MGGSRIRKSEPYEHDWTENQICLVLDKISNSKNLVKIFFNKQGIESPSSILAEQELCIELLGSTSWITYMIQNKRVIRDSNGLLRLKSEQWPKRLRVISKLFDFVHPSAEKIRNQLGPYHSVVDLNLYNSDGYKQWKEWQAQGQNTWYFKYVFIKQHIDPKWLKRNISSPSSTTGMETASRREYNPINTSQYPREAPPHLRGTRATYTTTDSSKIDISMNDIEMTLPLSSHTPSSTPSIPAYLPPTPISAPRGQGYPAPTHHNDLTGGTQRDSEENKITGREEFIAAMLVLISQELNHRPSSCMAGCSIIHNKAISISEQSVLYLIKKLGGNIINASTTSIQDTLKDKKQDTSTAFILWSTEDDYLSGPIGLDREKGDSPTPITLVGLVHLIIAKRKIELGEGQIDLLTF
ncbi:uncharacterized protein I206_107073 [Kwoniella pini CBS 10737]|uniref:Uncharacterized protein n=1 Tax=Kwoniella pini CBS 10737 TaxID=1296096 RepID=A0A1B9HZ85_9TREE|nr:uncharacterized protein I206_05383 [Kwoniella pini CBS 10737]OCF48603.1 hypothetical protein I206_05383 [Kwoniella pini CBS 10737]